METAGIDIDKARDFLREKENRARKKQRDEKGVVIYDKSKLALLKSEIRRDSDKLARLFEKFNSSYSRYKQKKEYAYLVESAFL